MSDGEGGQQKKFRIITEGQQAYLYYEAPEPFCAAERLEANKKTDIPVKVEVSRPITREKLEIARIRLMEKIIDDKDSRLTSLAQTADETLQREIHLALGLARPGNIFARASIIVREILIALAQIFFGLCIVSLAYKGVQLSQDYLPSILHVLVLVFYSVLLMIGLVGIATEKNRWKMNEWVRQMFGPRGWLLFAVLLLVTSAAVFASISYLFFSQHWIDIQPHASATVSVASLLDFYMWHFTNLLPFIDFNNILLWDMPLEYSQSRVGFLILLFQACVVLPTISTARFYFKNRDILSANRFDFVY